ncbi:hypothetical protein A2662_02790 [Candidatus Giovannonibacteria bacterium RIFCSPHIGHO2_01_FULL_45_33]|uniref:Uncharacterized protein n=1 Tax=Candidatus Giovannonibacteria bacterium RIFCSPLOWO2_01_FULL_45_34 TaxID=1798351 RepID=A0A1F5X1F0_9BACT|nr:MAG: hypothetical protein A2662_02790 [Candidatus Giovannonibacteria bacterium RIFCSPHIGHO2_01_FULL_45_33]OGF70926.1 MAG: hypothetical protein A3C73_00945 [Candidatus Giovannonibacteria bacterium RIFCSPHIGHO2_02_FULL_44_11]OGF81726.1 MAG: hypothetical protein A2930_03955 [Candidatus Giovannonibacteria bacterium RIFCSPLOWO2_01_FULL_45_34]
MKRFLIGAAVILTLLVTVHAEAKEAWHVVKKGSGHDHIVKGLQQFPLTQYLNYKYATYVGFGRGCATPPEYAGGECVTLTLVTGDDELVRVEVELPSFEMTLFLHELSPHFGKYKWWSPVLQIKEKPLFGGDKYQLIDIVLLGRFKMVLDKNPPHGVVGYTNEVY